MSFFFFSFSLVLYIFHRSPSSPSPDLAHISAVNAAGDAQGCAIDDSREAVRLQLFHRHRRRLFLLVAAHEEGQVPAASNRTRRAREERATPGDHTGGRGCHAG